MSDKSYKRRGRGLASPEAPADDTVAMQEHSSSRTPPPTSIGADTGRGIRHEEWKGRIQMAMDVDELVRVVREYLAAWQPHQLARLPIEVGATALANSSDISVRAVLAAQADLRRKGEGEAAELLHQMALTLMAAATRLRYLLTIRTREGTPVHRPD